MSTGSKMQPQIRPIVNRDKPTTKKLGDVVMQAVWTQANFKDPSKCK